MDYVSHTYSVNANIIDLMVCYWTDYTPAPGIDYTIIQIPIPPGNNDYILNIEIYSSIS